MRNGTHLHRYVYTTPRDNQAAIEADNVREARTVLTETYDRGYEAGRLLGRLESVILMALTASIALIIWRLVG